MVEGWKMQRFLIFILLDSNIFLFNLYADDVLPVSVWGILLRPQTLHRICGGCFNGLKTYCD